LLVGEFDVVGGGDGWGGGGGGGGGGLGSQVEQISKGRPRQINPCKRAARRRSRKGMTKMGFCRGNGRKPGTMTSVPGLNRDLGEKTNELRKEPVLGGGKRGVHWGVGRAGVAVGGHCRRAATGKRPGPCCNGNAGRKNLGEKGLGGNGLDDWRGCLPFFARWQPSGQGGETVKRLWMAGGTKTPGGFFKTSPGLRRGKKGMCKVNRETIKKLRREKKEGKWGDKRAVEHKSVEGNVLRTIWGGKRVSGKSGESWALSGKRKEKGQRRGKGK